MKKPKITKIPNPMLRIPAPAEKVGLMSADNMVRLKGMLDTERKGR